LAPLEEEIQKKSKGDKGPLQLVMRNANRLLELVNQLLDLSKLEAGKMQMQVSQGNILNFCNALASSFDSLAQQKQIKFEKKISLPHTAWFDSDKLEKILTNLLANAFKFTPADGTVTLMLESKQGNEKISISVTDTGRGIPKSEQEKVFTAFYQVKQTTDSHEVGTGLGLSLVRELVRIYGGNISLESIEGLGTVFNVELPIAKKAFSQDQINENISRSIAKPSSNISVEIDHEQDGNAEQVEERDSILIVEDNADLRDYMRSVLKKEFNILTANDGHQGLTQAVKDVPSLVLTDLMMPVMDGMELTEKLKTNEATSHIPVIMLTARNEHKTKIQGLKTGADDYLTKPFSIEELMARVINLISIRKKLAQRYRQHVPTPAATFLDEPSLDDKFLFKVREVVEKNLHDTSFSVEKLAEEVFLSRTQLLRKLKALTSLSPTDFIKDMRLQKAAHLIRQKSDTITQIGYSVGFNDQSYFTKCFKKEFGLTPSEYSNQVK
jgi:DNA-binding response OmpR family regulator/two-component sensor histidine kinase